MLYLVTALLPVCHLRDVIHTHNRERERERDSERGSIENPNGWLEIMRRKKEREREREKSTSGCEDGKF